VKTFCQFAFFNFSLQDDSRCGNSIHFGSGLACHIGTIFQPSAIGCRISVISCQTSVISYRNSVKASRKIVFSILYYVLCM